MDLLTGAIEHYKAVESYRVTIRSFHSGGDEHIHYYYKKPGFVRMEFVHPHAGAVLAYNPNTRRVRVWPFGAGHFPELELSPGNPLIQSLRGQRIDRSDIGALFENVHALWGNGSAEMLAEENMNGRTIQHFTVTGTGDFMVSGVHCYELWLDTATRFPIRITSRNQQGDIIETVIMETLEINPTLPQTLFDP